MFPKGQIHPRWSVCTQLKKLSGQFRQKTKQTKQKSPLWYIAHRRAAALKATTITLAIDFGKASRQFATLALSVSLLYLLATPSATHLLITALNFTAQGLSFSHTSPSEPRNVYWSYSRITVPATLLLQGYLSLRFSGAISDAFLSKQQKKKQCIRKKKTKPKQNKPVKTQLSSRLQINLILPSFKCYLAVAQCYNSSSHWHEAPALTRQNSHQIVLQKCVYLLIQK